MAVTPVWLGNAYYEADEGKHYEGFAESRSDVSAFSTDYAVGSFIYCGEDGSKWILGTNSGSKEWMELQ